MGKASKRYTNVSGKYEGIHSRRSYHDHGRYGQNNQKFMVGQRNDSRERPSGLFKLTEKKK